MDKLFDLSNSAIDFIENIKVDNGLEEKAFQDALNDIQAYIANLYSEISITESPTSGHWVRTNKPFHVQMYRCGDCGWYEINMIDGIRNKCPMCGHDMSDDFIDDME